VGIRTLRLVVVCLCLSVATPVVAQTPGTSQASTPRVVRLTGTFHPADGLPPSPVESVTVTMYSEQTGGAPLWQETQMVTIGANGQYALLLGATSAEGLPLELFATGEARWLGTRFERAGEVELPRVLVAAVPYALKAADADTLGGRPPSAYLLAGPGSSDPSGSKMSEGPITAGTEALTSGASNFIAKFMNGTDLGNSAMFESGGLFGINTTTPLDALHVRFTNTNGGLTGLAVQNLGNTATSYSGLLFYDQNGALAQFQGFNNSTHEYRINNIAPGGSINFMIGSVSRFRVNNNGSVQAPGDLAVGGNATAATLTGNIVKATTQYNIGNDRILSAPLVSNLFVGTGAGESNTSGDFNAFVGFQAGFSNAIGTTNVFVGALAGQGNVNGSENAFFGVNAGRSNSSGIGNAFFGSGGGVFGAGFSNFEGNFNSFFGHRAGEQSNGSLNAFFGTAAGRHNSSGNGNTIVGHDAGATNTSGSFNVVIGDSADVGAGDLTNATAIGANALVTASNALVLGSINGQNGATADTKVGIGTTAPTERLHVIGNGAFSGNLLAGGTISGNAINGGSGSFTFGIQAGSVSVPSTSLGGVTTPRLTVGGPINVGTIAFSPVSGGSLSLCVTSLFSQIATCSSSLRYKQNVQSFSPGLALIDRLRPVSFNWKADNRLDLGLVAEEVAEVEPLLATYNAKGDVEGVKYDRVGVVLINAIKEQQAQIQQQRKQIESLQRQLDALAGYLRRSGSLRSDGPS
jgi:Chaperone of endosialidase